MSWSDLTEYLRSSNARRIVLTFAEIERIIGRPLPESARKYRPLWANSKAGNYSRHWMNAGYMSTSVEVPSGSMAFEPTRTPISSASPRTADSLSMSRPETTTSDEVTERVILVGCVKTKLRRPAPAKDLYISDQFLKRRAYAETQPGPWYILSARHGLVCPDDLLEPYDVALADQGTRYRAAWGEWVAVRLEAELGSLAGGLLEIHAGATYADALDGPLIERGAKLLRPLEGLRQGEQLAWYNRAAAPPQAVIVAHEPDEVAVALHVLTNASQSLDPGKLVSRGPRALNKPGLYSWWVDEVGVRDLSNGLGVMVRPGLIYAGQAGATRWPSGRRSRNTLWERIVGMHLDGSVEFSTFRKTLDAVLRGPLELRWSDDPRLSEWMRQHLRVIAWPHDDPDALGRMEAAVLRRLDPPLNLKGMNPSPVRDALQRLRRGR
jgi:hypothetical protein